MGGVARRQFLTAAGAMLAAPLALGQPPHRIGPLPDHYGAYLAWFLEAMRRQGWREGRELTLVQPGLLFGVSHEEAARRVGVLMYYLPPDHAQVESELIHRDLREGASRLGLAIHFAPLLDAQDVDSALRDLDVFSPDAVVLTTGLRVWPVRQKVLAFALGRGWPTIADVSWDPKDALQPLMHYGPSMRLLIQEAAAYVVRILRDDAKPAELPMLRPAKFELSINTRTARALGLEVPSRRLLLRADRVIE